MSYQATVLTIGLLLTPLLLRYLGPDLYGIWVLLGTLVAYESISDLGIPAAMVMFLNLSRSPAERNGVATIGIGANTALTAAVILLLLLLQDSITGLFLQTEGLAPATLSLAYRLTLASLAFLVLARSFSSILDAQQRVDVRFAADIVGSVFFALLAWLAIRRQYGLVGVVAASLLAAIVRAGLTMVAVYLLEPGLKPDIARARGVAGRVFAYGLKSQGANLGAALSDPLLKGVIGIGAGPASAGAVQMGSSVSAVPNAVAFSAIANLFPSIAAAFARHDRQTVERLTEKYLVAVACLIVPATAAIIIVADDLIVLWLGATYPEAQLALKTTAVAFALRALAMVPWRVSWGLDRPAVSSVAMLLNLGVLTMGGAALLATSRATLAGMLLLFVASYVVSTIYLYWSLFQSLPRLWSENGQRLAGYALRISMVTGLGSGLLLLSSGRMPAFSRLIVAVLVALGATGISFGWTGVLEGRMGWRRGRQAAIDGRPSPPDEYPDGRS